MPTDTTWQDVAAVLVTRWLAGPGNRGWDHEQIAGFIEECKVDKLTPHWALVGLRGSSSDFIPSVGGVRRLAHAAMGPPSIAEIQAAETRARLAATPQRLRLAAG